MHITRPQRQGNGRHERQGIDMNIINTVFNIAFGLAVIGSLILMITWILLP